jgi:hypothetical protein
MIKPIGSVKSTFMLLPLVASTLVLLPLATSGFAQQQPSRLRPPALQIHPSARSLIESYEKLVAGTRGVSTGTTGVSICNVGNPNSGSNEMSMLMYQ